MTANVETGLLGIDVGTSGVKVVLCDEKGVCHAQTTREYPFQQPRPGYVEQDPDVWWRETALAIRDVIRAAGVEPAAIKGIGLTGQMHSLVLLDKAGKVIRPAILWSDQRTQAQVDWIADHVGVEKTIQYTANPPLTNFTATKLLWVRDEEPENYARIDKVLLPKDYIRYRLTGAFATDVSDASGMLLLDVEKRCWSKEMCAALDVPTAWLPEVYESINVTGEVSSEAAQAAGLAAGTKVVAGAGDQAAGAIGNGVVRPGVVSSTIGTSGVVFAYADTIVKDPQGRLHTFCHAVPGAWHVMGVTQSAGGSLQWFRNEFAQLEQATANLIQRDPYELLALEAEKAPAGSDGLIYLPYLMGERTPHLDPLARGVFFGMTARHQRAHFVRAIMEGVAYSLQDCMQLIRDLNLPIDHVRVSGGGARSPLWRSIQADVFAQSVYTVQANEGPAFGAALLAGVGSGCFATIQDACDELIQTSGSTEANAANQAVYQQYHHLYGDVYRSLRSSFQALHATVQGIEG
ncbi:xylulokinase [Alicyclobacillus fodiniaquatilis]|uniref:Xylulose kinase n=1 Tax=Alicyclobacillus fodiniaquatilis TaxID=1661150 RepID=A0ABW4JB59_9BACL